MSRIRQLDELASIFLSKSQKYLLNFSKKNVIKEEDALTSSDEESYASTTIVR
jgi:hypothetical protein